jgi:ABC-2 type transport system permease protein
MAAVGTFNWNVLWFFPVYFLGGFFLYGSLMAAAGSAVDNVQDAQQFLFPVMIPMILPLLFMFNIIQNPNSSFAVFASLFPFFSPMGMMIRVSLTSVPWYEILFSILLLIGTFLFCVWVAARIYRVGILMYGKKPSFRELIKWIRY